MDPYLPWMGRQVRIVAPDDGTPRVGQGQSRQVLGPSHGNRDHDAVRILYVFVVMQG